MSASGLHVNPAGRRRRLPWRHHHGLRRSVRRAGDDRQAADRARQGPARGSWRLRFGPGPPIRRAKRSSTPLSVLGLPDQPRRDSEPFAAFSRSNSRDVEKVVRRAGRRPIRRLWERQAAARTTLRGVARRPSQRCGDARRHRSVHRGIRLVHDGVYRAQALHGRSRRPGRPRTALPQEFDENSFNAQDWAVLDGRCGRRSARTPARPARRVPRGDRLRPAVCVVRNQRQPIRAQHDSVRIGAR